MDTNPISKEFRDKADSFIGKGFNETKIKEQLLKEQFSDEKIVEFLKYFKKIGYEKRRKRGTWMVIIGSTLLIFGFVLALLFFNNNASAMNYCMYGITSLGLILVFIGMIDFFGW